MTRAPLVITMMVASGCYTVGADLPGTLRNDVKQQDVEVVGKLEIERTHYYALDGLIGKPPADMFAAEIKKAVQKRGADGVTNLVYESEHTCGDVAITGCTLGCLAPRTYRLTGDVVRIKAARVPGRPAKLVDNSTSAQETVRVAHRY